MFVSSFADFLAPSVQLTEDALFCRDDACELAFTGLKEPFVRAPILAHFEEGHETVVETDASG